MSFEFDIPFRRIESVFGTGFPSANFTDGRRIVLLTNLLQNKFELTREKYSSQPRIELHITSRSRLNKKITVEISGDSKTAYQKAIAIEKYLWSLPRLGYLSPPRWWNRIIQRRPVDMFLIDKDMTAEVVDWLQENCHHRDYQFISKFKYDITLGFRNEEAATLFKLTFGDKPLISKDSH